MKTRWECTTQAYRIHRITIKCKPNTCKVHKNALEMHQECTTQSNGNAYEMHAKLTPAVQRHRKCMGSKHDVHSDSGSTRDRLGIDPRSTQVRPRIPRESTPSLEPNCIDPQWNESLEKKIRPRSTDDRPYWQKVDTFKPGYVQQRVAKWLVHNK